MTSPGLELKYLNRILVTTSMEFIDKKDSGRYLMVDENPISTETSFEMVLDGLRNRHERRHRNNKKLYE